MLFLRLLLLVSLTSACTFGTPIKEQKWEGKKNTGSSYKKPKSYIVFGKQYTILESSEGFTQRGKASWYGKKFHGRKTANGEIYDMFDMTAAHKTLPLPTILSVKNLENGKSIIVRVNDRGPFVGERILDLSYAAAQQLDIIQDGTALVEIKALNKNSQTAPPIRAIPLKASDADDIDIFVQVGSFSKKINAENLLFQLKQSSINNAIISPTTKNQQTFYRVRLGPYSIVEKAQKMVEQLHKKSYKESRLVID